MTKKMSNVFEPGIIREYPVIQQIKDLMEENGVLKAMMSGSGPTVFGIFDDKQQAQRCLNHMREQGNARQAYITDVYNVR